MIDVKEAQELVLDTAEPLAAERVAALEALGRVVAEDIASDIDSPPYDKSLMDGYAVRAEDIGPGVTLTVIEELTAGQVPRCPVGAGQAIRIMTGAPLPLGADAVLPVEETQPVDGGDRIRVLGSGISCGQHVLRQGAAMRRGETILERGRIVRAVDVGLLAEVGRTSVSVIRRPTVAILATGDELVAADQVPGPGQIRNSNTAMLTALVHSAGALAIPQGIVPDDDERLRATIRQALHADVVLLTGGVSVGIRDYVPRTLQELGITSVFHGVRLKPGKPVWYGWMAGPQRRWVFGLPGNPVSCLVCFELFVRVLLDKLLGRGDRRQQRVGHVQLEEPLDHPGGRATYFPARVSFTSGVGLAKPLPWKGSADLRTLGDAHALLVLPPQPCRYRAGDTLEVLWLKE